MPVNHPPSPAPSEVSEQARKGRIYLRGQGFRATEPSIFRGLFAYALVGIGVVTLLQIYYICLGPNFHTLLPNRIYRSSQLSGTELREAHRRFGIKAVLNLRGCCADQDWYQEESAICRELGLEHIDINLSTYMPPHRLEFIKLLDALDSVPEPFLIHCRQGADRTSLASAVALLLKTDADLATAQAQLSLRYGHAPFGKVQVLDKVLEDYAAWLADQQWVHEPKHLRLWIREHYRPGPFWAQIEALEMPPYFRRGEWSSVRVRVTNRSNAKWHFRQAAHVGNHLGFVVTGSQGKVWASGLAGCFDHELGPGESLVLSIAIPPLRHVGSCKLFIDMRDEQWCLFHMVGSPPLEQELMVLPWPMPLIMP